MDDVSRFFFHIENGDGLQQDEVGTDFATPALAIGEAAKMAGEILRDDTRDLLADYRVTIRVADDDGASIGEITVALSLAV